MKINYIFLYRLNTKLDNFQMAEIIFQRRKVATILSPPDPLIILLLMSLLQLCVSQVINRAPHFEPQTGDMSQFSISEDTPVGTPVYHLKGNDCN